MMPFWNTMKKVTNYIQCRKTRRQRVWKHEVHVIFLSVLMKSVLMIEITNKYRIVANTPSKCHKFTDKKGVILLLLLIKSEQWGLNTPYGARLEKNIISSTRCDPKMMGNHDSQCIIFLGQDSGVFLALAARGPSLYNRIWWIWRQ